MDNSRDGNIRDKIKWLSMDEDGWVWGFSKKPMYQRDFWGLETYDGDDIDAQEFFKINENIINWKESLISVEELLNESLT